MSLEQEIKAHTRRVEDGELILYAVKCAHCEAVKGFRLHERRSRQFRLVVEGIVKVLSSWILRWNCHRCGQRFTDYPPFRLAARAVCGAGRAGIGQGLSGAGVDLSEGR